MAIKGALIVIVNCLILHFFFALDLPSYIINSEYPVSFKTLTNISFGLTLLLFPLFGLLADAYFTRYRVIQVALGIFSIILIFALIILGFAVTTFAQLKNTKSHLIGPILLAIIFMSAIASIGLFEANAIQFGMDQLLEASSSQLSAFIHWYFWSMHLGQEILFCIVFMIVFATPVTYFLHFSHFEEHLISTTVSVILLVVWMSCIVTSSSLFYFAKKHMYIAKAGINPFKKMWKVMIFAWKNTHPLNRSAFTYCEENNPSRFDLGKEQYGGLNTMEEVEDVKTFLRLLLLLVTLFGYHVAGDGFSTAQHMEHYSCPSLIVWELITINPASVSSVVALILIPLFHCLPKIHRLTPNLLKRIGIGMSVLLLQEVIYTVLTALPVVHKSTTLFEHERTFFNTGHNTHFFCYYVRVMNDTGKLSYGPHSVDNTFLWLIGPQILNGFAQILIHMTVLEFLCAQAPRTMQGLLIGFWYAMFSIRYLLMSSLDHVFTSSLGMLIYQAVRSGIVIVSLVLYLCVSRTYQYRVRDWVVNVQWMVEDIIERRMDQEERYMRQQEVEGLIFLASSSSEDDYMDH